MTPALLEKLGTLQLPMPDQNGQWRGVLKLQGASDLAEFEATAELLSYIARFANTGAFAPEGHQMHDGSDLDIHVQKQKGSLEAIVIANNLHPGAWRVLVQMLAHCHQMEPYETLSLHALDGYTLWQSRQLIAQQSYPGMLSHANVAVSISEEYLQDDSLDMQLRTSRELTANEVRDICDLVDDWGTLVFVGGFSAIDEAVDGPLLNRPNTFRAGKQAINVQVQQFAGSPKARVSLINLALALSQRYAIEQIEIG